MNLPESLIARLEQLVEQAHRVLPPLPTPPDFDAPAFIWQNKSLISVYSKQPVALSDLLGIERQKQRIIQNTQQFLAGFPANDVLLTGARGTGKSSLIRGLLTDYQQQGLRVIEVARDDLAHLSQIRSMISGRPEKFIVYCDDLAFNAEDENYRALKSALDGSVQSNSGNVLIYATSNRRHLLPEFMHENQPLTRTDAAFQGEIHPQESVEEKVSLSDRFGLWLAFHPMDQDTYLDIVTHWLNKQNIPLDEIARAEALKWSLARGQRSGRAAAQFARHWSGLKLLENSQLK
ncbi:ATP-binding protein [Aquirhabdus sp.]|uniref:ATP-binding protein n=1 Tax=Aquirhabdus sp. TaxID=2824160 RepID=UPI00396CF207